MPWSTAFLLARWSRLGRTIKLDRLYAAQLATVRFSRRRDKRTFT